MDDILITAEKESILNKALKSTTTAVQQAGFIIVKEKIQCASPWKYLQYQITSCTIQPQPLLLNQNPWTPHDLQKLTGTINWVRLLLGINNENQAPLTELVRGDSDLNSPRQLTREAKEALN